MYYYGYNGGYGNVAPSCSQAPTCCGGSGYGAAIILVLFILLVIVFGAGFNNCSNR
ncbi:MAG: sporulation protein YjcZ [Bacilli bacterium]